MAEGDWRPSDPLVGKTPGAAPVPQRNQPGWAPSDPVVGKGGARPGVGERAPPVPINPNRGPTEPPALRDPETGLPMIDITRNPPPPSPVGPGSAPQKRVTPLGADAFSQQQDMIRQGVNPHALSPYFPDSPDMAPQFLGYVEEIDGKGFYRTQDPATGKEVMYSISPLRPDGEGDFTAPHPDNGRMAVWSRTPQTNENAMVRASRMIVPGLGVGPVTMSTPGSTQRLLAAREEAARRLLADPHSSAAPPPGMPPPMLPGIGDTEMARLQAERAAELTRDRQAFDELGVRQVPAYFQSTPGAAAGQLVKSIPGVGIPMNRAVDQSVHEVAGAARRVSEELGTTNVEQAGAVLQRGLERFRTATTQEVEPGQLTALGIQPRAPGEYAGTVRQLAPNERAPMMENTRPQNSNGQIITRADGRFEWFDPNEHIIVNDAGRLQAYRNSGRYDPEQTRGQAARAAAAQPIVEDLHGGTAYTNRGVPVPAARPLDEVIMGRRGAADLSDEELTALINLRPVGSGQAGPRAPVSDVSWRARAEALYEKAWRSIPNMFRSDGSRNPGMLPTPNTRYALGAIDAQIANDIAGQSTINAGLAERLRNPHAGNFTLDDLRSIRTEIGRTLGNLNPLQVSLNRQQLEMLYAAVTRDMEQGLLDLRNRAYMLTRVSNNAENYVPPEVARRADQALRDFRVADRYYRQGMYNMDQFRRILGTDNPQQAAAILLRSAQEGMKGNMRLFRQAIGALRPEERREVASAVLREMGTPAAGGAGVAKEAGFSPDKFMTAWDAMSPAARRLLFGDEHANAMDGLSREIHNIARVAGRMRSFNKEMNTSRSGTHIMQFLTYLLGGAAVMNGQTMLLAGALAPLTGISVALSSPKYVGLMAQYVRLRAQMERLGPDRVMPQMAVFYNQLHRATLADPSMAPILRAIAQEHGIGQGNNNDQQQEKPVRRQQP